jgi:hypothetical protein
MDTKFFDSLFGGDSANGAKLCMGLTEGDFWARPAGVQLLYQGQDDNVDFDRITAVSEIDEGVLEISAGQSLSSFLYVVRRVNCCGAEEKTLGAAVRVEFDSLGNLIERSCNKVFIIAAKQVAGDRILLKWFYQLIHQSKKINTFKIYYDNGTGTIDYQNPIGSVNYIGRKFYQFITGQLSGDSYKFCIRAAAEDNSDDNFTGQIKIELNKQSPDGISILICQTE